MKNNAIRNLWLAGWLLHPLQGPLLIAVLLIHVNIEQLSPIAQEETEF